MPHLNVALQKPDWLTAMLSVWVNEGGAVVEREAADDSEPPLSQAELKQLRIRVVALENVLLALLSTASTLQREQVAQMARHISPRPGSTAHRVTLHAADEIVSLLARSKRAGRAND